MTVLYIEDDFDDQELFKDALVEVGFKTNLIVAISGEEAFELLEEMIILPDVVFTDMNLTGGMIGSEVVSRFKSDPRLRQVPIFIYSTSSQSKASMQPACPDGYILKPNAFREVVDMLVRTLSLHQPGSTNIRRTNQQSSSI